MKSLVIFSSLVMALSQATWAQSLLEVRKPAHEIPHPSSEVQPTSVPPAWSAPPLSPGSGLQPDNPFGPIAAPVRWYAIELADDASYWAGVDLERIWIELDAGASFADVEIAAFLDQHGLHTRLRESGRRSHTTYAIFALSGGSPESITALAMEARGVPGIKFLEPCVTYRRMSVPNDPLWQFQWGPLVINAVDAWEITTGGSWNVIAVIDDAVDWNHPDLFDQVWYGYDYGMDDFDPTPDHFSQNHGTHVTGTIAASTDNNLGMAGMVNDTVYFAKVTDGTYDPELGNFSDAAIIDAIYDIAQYDRIGVINMSLGGGAPAFALEQACTHAWNAGKILIVASGNDGASSIAYPAAYEACMAVGAVGADGVNLYLSAYSNYGNQQEIVAPGGDYNAGYGIISTVLFNEYEAMEGTSMACPHVAGVAGLILAANPSLTNFEVRNILNNTATDFGNSGWDQVFGYGMVNAGMAVQTAAGVVLGSASKGAERGPVLYPNPTADAVYVNGPSTSPLEHIEIHDLSGKLVWAQGNTEGGVQRIDVSHFRPGLYLLRARHADGWVTGKFAKQ